MATTTVSSKLQVVIPRALREKHRLTSRRQAGWRALRGSAKGTNALKAHFAEHRRGAEHRREAKR